MSRLRRSAFPQGMVLYHIYPRSFQDSNGDGIGDLPGIISRLDYLQGLGITAIWLSPFYPSPMIDFGYDVANYCDVDPIFGSLNDVDELVRQAHKRGIRIIFDLVANHTSDQHAWFHESRSSLHNPKRNWYIWRKPKADGSPPNNWLSAFTGPAWTLDRKTNQYYLHSFAPKQPDLNLRNPEVREAIKDVMRFWLDRGIDGFRVDAVHWYGKDAKLRNDPKNPNYDPKRDPDPYNSLLHTRSKSNPILYRFLKEFSQVVKPYGNRLLISEAYPDRRFAYQGYLSFYAKISPDVLAPFNFEAIYLPWKAKAFQRYIDGFQQRLKPGYVPVYVMGNIDRARLATRFSKPATRAAGMLLLTLPGVPVIYYGEELGMENVAIAPNQAQDVAPPYNNRDPERTPMQWTAGKYAGFSEVQPWLPLAPDHRTQNVEVAGKNPASLLRLYQALVALRHKTPALSYGSYQPLRLQHPDLLGFVRQYQRQKLAVVINFSDTQKIASPTKGQLVLSTVADPDPTTLQAFEGRILEL